ncbi:OTU domain-containing protein [Tanacetum coccineum]
MATWARRSRLPAKNCLLPRTDVLEHLELNDLPKYPSGILAERINTINFIVKMALGDGNCLFRALSKILHLTQKFHMDVRKALVDEVKT